MNNLSWLIYLGELSSSLSNLLCFLAFAFLCLTIGTAIWYFAALDGWASEEQDIENTYEEKVGYYNRSLVEALRYPGQERKLIEPVRRVNSYKRISVFLPIAAGVLFLLSALTATALPSKETVYAIAASQFGEQLIKTPLAAKAEKAVEAWLDRQISPEVPK